MKRFFKYIIIIAVIFGLDFVSKTCLLSFLANKYGDMVYSPLKICANCDIQGIFVPWKYIIGNDFGLSHFFNIHFVWNTGTSFSILRSLGAALPIVLIIATALIIALLLYYLFKRSMQYERLPLAMIIGGALGNLVDRIRFGAVADFVQWHIFNFWHFPAIFNIGDIFITFGVCIYLVLLFINRRRDKKSKEK